MSALSLRRLQDEHRGGGACPDCGCRQTSIDENGSRVCRHCGRRRLAPPAPPVVRFQTAMSCPGCQTRGRVTSTRASEGYRWWKCDACGKTWKEVGE
jgi:hypothetical protein